MNHSWCEDIRHSRTPRSKSARLHSRVLLIAICEHEKSCVGEVKKKQSGASNPSEQSRKAANYWAIVMSDVLGEVFKSVRGAASRSGESSARSTRRRQMKPLSGS